MSLPWEELQQVIEASATGDQEAREQLVANCYPDVRARVHKALEGDFRKRHRWIMPLFSTQDVVHEVLTGVVDDLADTQFDGPEPFYAYLGTLVRHRLLDAVRFHEAARRDSRKNVAEPEGGMAPLAADAREATPTLAASIGERAGLVREALDELPERQRRLLELRLLEDETFPVIREALGYSSDETARLAFRDAQARLLVKLRTKGLGRTLSS
ncbi:MAG: sigma-70 family RNA polymerase sigma factor [Planctomycetota bacterium]|nr:sigma-70 family RNA polymerase sigma factor [Planctomycetota bacterium]